MDPIEKKTNPQRTRILLLVTGALILISALIFFYWWKWSRFDEYTNDAYVSGNLLYVTPQVSAAITKVYVNDTQLVESGHLLLELDPTDFELDLEENKQNLAQVIRDVSELFIQTKQAEAQTLAVKAEFIKKAEDFERRYALVSSGGVSQEDFSHAEREMQNAYFTLAAAEQQYFSLFAQVKNTTVSKHPRVLYAAEKLKKSFVNLSRCKIYAPNGGLIAQRSAQVGQRTQLASPLMAIVPLDQMWVDANYREDQIGSMQIGQNASLTTDIYGSKCLFHGKIIGIGGGTGSVFSLLPPQNATGNWIKIVQRVPVRIQINQEECKERPLRLGLSVEVHTDIHPINSSAIPVLAGSTALYETDVFNSEESGADSLIKQIILENLSFSPWQEEEL